MQAERVHKRMCQFDLDRIGRSNGGMTAEVATITAAKSRAFEYLLTTNPANQL
jgi:hypothetical protein